jgi:N-acyl-L-homoserine lactone synthetase
LVQAKISKKSRANILKVLPEHCIEISGLAKEKDVPTEAVLELYRSMWLYSFEKDHKIWLMACDTKLYKRLKILFGSSIRRIGRRTSYKGGDIIPCVLDLSKSSKHLEKNLMSKHPVYGDIRRKVARKFLYDHKIS